MIILIAIPNRVASQDNEKRSESVQKQFNRAYYYLSVDKEKAVELLSECILVDSTFTDAYFHRGVTYYKMGKYDSALFDFNVCNRQRPEQSIIWLYKGFTFRNLGNTDKAFESFSNYINENPQDTSAYSYILKGKIKYELGDFSAAINAYDMALKLKPYEEKYQYYRFIALFEAGKYKQAEQAVEQLIKINPNFYGYYFYKGNLYEEMRVYEKAIDMYNIAIIKNYQVADSYYHRAMAYQTLKQYNEAMEDYNTAIMLKSNDGTFFSERGNCLYLMGEKQEACKNWNEAGALGYYEDFDKMKDFCDNLNSVRILESDNN